MLKAKQRGAQAVEFALMLPFLILIIFAVIDFGILVNNKAVITNAAREAARRGTVLTASAWNPDRVKQIACNYIKSAVITVNNGTKKDDCTGTDDPVITVETLVTPPAFNDPVTVNISYAFRGFSMGTWWNLGVGDNAVGSPITLTASAEMLHE